MLFTSLPFLGLLSITLALYYLPKLSRWQVPVLILAGLIFYGYYQPTLVLLLLISASVVIVTSYLVARRTNHYTWIAGIGVAVNLGILAFFKYSGFLVETVHLTGSISDFFTTLPLPLGISFFTFQGITLLIDAYQHKLPATAAEPRSFPQHALRSLLFVSFFPTITSGPILKAHEFVAQIQIKLWRDIPWEHIMRNVILGLFLKTVVADNLKDYTFWMDHPYFTVMPQSSLVVMIFAYSVQLFADFAGYSLIAIGIARLFGYSIPDNFNFPYIATSFQDFWRRWHISLSTFFRNYLYFPLGGNRKGYTRTLLNILIVMGLSGLWHGAAWSYVVWGLFHGVMLVWERISADFIKLKTSLVAVATQRIMVFILVSIGWLLFKLPDIHLFVDYLQAIVANNFRGSEEQRLQILRMLIYASPVLFYHLAYLWRERPWMQRLHRFDYVVYALLLFLVLTNRGTAQAFIYFQF